MEREGEAERMEERLCYAAMKGDLKSLQEIIAIDDSILDRVLVGIFRGKNPLHVAVSTGQTQFVSKLLEIKPGLAEVLDVEHGTALHIASAKGHLEIVKALVKVSPKTCLARDGDGNRPVHIAAMKGQLQVLEELVRANFHIAQVKGNRGDTILHLCVKYDQFECLELLLPMNLDPYFVHDVDIDGNTILHLAVFEKQLEMIKLVLSDKNIGIAVNAINKRGRSPLDIHDLQFRSESQSDSEIEDILLDAGAKRFKRGKQGTVGDDRLEPSWQTKRRNSFMIVSSLIATMAYQVGVNPPGGVWLDDAEEHKVGKAILAYNYPDFYPIFMCLNTAGFLVSLTTILLLIISLPERGWGLRWAQALITWCTIATTAFSYTFSIIAISPAGKKYIYDRDASKVIKFRAMAWAFGMSLVLVWHLRDLTIGFLKEQRGLMKCMNRLSKVLKGIGRHHFQTRFSRNGPNV